LIPILSIVIPNHNYGGFLPRLFRCLAEQTADLGQMEVIFVDDGSTDDSVPLARTLGSTLGCARFQSLQAGGKGHPGPVRNKGFAVARGPLLWYLDADDLVAPTFLQSCLDVFASSPETDLVYTAQYQLWNGREHPLPDADAPIILPKATPALLTWQNVLTSPAMFRRKVWQSSSGFRTNTLYEDWDFWLQAACNGFAFSRIKSPLFYYCRHESSFSHKAERTDATAKAQIVRNNPAAFHPIVRKWAEVVRSEACPMDTFPRGIIPLPKDALAALDTHVQQATPPSFAQAGCQT